MAYRGGIFPFTPSLSGRLYHLARLLRFLRKPERSIGCGLTLSASSLSRHRIPSQNGSCRQRGDRRPASQRHCHGRGPLWWRLSHHAAAAQDWPLSHRRRRLPCHQIRLSACLRRDGVANATLLNLDTWPSRLVLECRPQPLQGEALRGLYFCWSSSNLIVPGHLPSRRLFFAHMALPGAAAAVAVAGIAAPPLPRTICGQASGRHRRRDRARRGAAGYWLSSARLGAAARQSRHGRQRR